MASAEKRSSGSFRATWRDSGGTMQHQGGFITRSAAQGYAEDMEAQVKSGLDVNRAKMTWGQWKPEWLAQRVVEASTLDSDLPRLAKWVEPEWGDKRLSTIRKPAVQSWVRRLVKDGHSAASIAKIFHLFSGSMRAAVDAEILPSSPCRGIKLPEPPESLGIAYTMEEIEAILYHLNEPYRTAALLMVYTGLRFGEMAGLHWNKVDLGARRLDIQQTWVPVDRSIKAYPKDRNFRAVRIPARLLDVLHRPQDWNTPCGHTHSDGKPCRSQLVLNGPLGAPLNAKNMRTRHWTPAVRTAGLEGRQYDLRHTFITWLVEAGVPLNDIAVLVGHTDQTMTRRYSHRQPTYGDRALAVLDGPAHRGPVPNSVPNAGLTVLPGLDVRSL